MATKVLCDICGGEIASGWIEFCRDRVCEGRYSGYNVPMTVKVSDFKQRQFDVCSECYKKHFASVLGCYVA